MEDLLYKALMLGRNKKTAREEFLVSAGRKEPASFAVCEKEILLTDVFRDVQKSVRIKTEKAGYLEIYAECADEFVQPEQRQITTDESGEGETEVFFTILAGKLHNGKNFGRIIFKSVFQQESVYITVDNRIALQLASENPAELSMKITQEYLDFRMGKLSKEQWQESVFKRLAGVNANTPRDLFLMLYKAHVYVISGDTTDSENILEYVSAQLSSREDYSAELFAYFLYVKSLYKMDEELTEAALKNVRTLYETSPSWELLWMCFYMDEAYAERPDKKLLEIKNLFLDGKCKSPVMYYEAWEILRNNPGYVKGCGAKFTLQILRFAIKNDIFEVGPALELSELLYGAQPDELSGINLNMALYVLEAAFDKYPVSALSNTIAELLIYTENRRIENHTYFERAVFDFAGIPGIYDYYFFTLDKTQVGRIPERLLHLYSKEEEPHPENRAYFYANLITNRYESYAYKTAYEACEERIKAFAYDSALKGKNDELLAVIYAHVLQISGNDKEFKRVLFKTAFIKRICCKNMNMERVLVFHKELSSYMEVPLENNEALVSIYSASFLILFKDRTGNIYKNIEFELSGFADEKEYAAVCIKEIPVSSAMLAGSCLKYTKENKKPEEILNFLLAELKNGEFTKEYQQSLITDIFKFSRALPADQGLYEKLMEFLKEDICDKARAVLIELMIDNKHYSEASKEIKENGFVYVAPESLRTLTHILVQLGGEEEREFILTLAGACLRNDTADTDILRYMCRYCTGPLDTLAELYDKSSKQGIYNLAVAERILIRCAQENKEPEVLAAVFSRCYEESNDRELIKSFLEYSAKKYLYGYKQDYLSFFEYFGKDFRRGTAFCDEARAAYLIYMKDADEIEPRLLKAVQAALEELVYKGIMFEEFKGYKNRFKIPPQLANSYIVRFDSAADTPPEITYTISSGRMNTEKTVHMNRIFPGIYVKYFTLLFGDSLTWSIQEGKSTSIRFSELERVPDDSRFAMADEISRLECSGNEEALKAALKRYYIKDELIRKLF